MQVIERDLSLRDGETLHSYDTGSGDLAVFWHHGSPNIGAPPAPLFAAAARLGIRWVSYDRPGYGGSTPRHGRDVASAAELVARVADELGIERFGAMGHSGGGPHALACGTLPSDRATAVVSISGLAPFGAEGLDWFAGMGRATDAALHAAAQGREAKEAFEVSDADLDPGFTPEDQAALAGDWSWLLEVVRPAVRAGPGGLIDDDLAAVGPWGFDPADIAVPTLLVHGGRDRVVPSSHSVWLARRVPSAGLWLRPSDGHVSVLHAAEAALEWLRTASG